MHVLPKVAHEQHDVLVPHVNALAAIADDLGTAPPAELAERLEAEHRFITSQLLPHMDRAEETVYPQLERLMQNRHSMTPMRNEHKELRAMIDELARLRSQPLGFGVQLRLRRVLYRMYAILKTHLAEEDAYIGVLDRNLSADEAEELARAMAHATADPL
jgi:hypothetical protein